MVNDLGASLRDESDELLAERWEHAIDVHLDGPRATVGEPQKVLWQSGRPWASSPATGFGGPEELTPMQVVASYGRRPAGR